MKTTSLILSIIGSGFAILFVIASVMITSLGNAFPDFLGIVAKSSFDFSDFICLVGALSGIFGGALAAENRMLGGFLMIIAVVLCFFATLGFISSILFLIGAVFAFIPKEFTKPIKS